MKKDKAQEVIEFIEMLRIPEGMDVGKFFVLREWQREIIRGVYGPLDENKIRIVRKGIFSVGKKNGKGLALDTPLPTPSGWTTMGKVSVGDVLYDENGRECNVVFESEVKNIDCYKVTFSNDDEIVCDEEHLWLTSALIGKPGSAKVYPRIKFKNKQVRNIEDIFNTQKCSNGTTNNHSIDITKPITGQHKTLLINPYVLGVWLGDGDSDNARISCGNEDVEEMLSILTKEGQETKAVQETGRNTWRVRLSKGNRWGSRKKKISYKLRMLNLYKNKHIPSEYLRASIDQRLSLLQGLMDTDGTCDKRGRAQEFVTISQRLVTGFCELVASLGIKYSVKVKPLRCNGRLVNGVGYYVQFCCLRDILPVFRIKRKLERQKKTTDRVMRSRSRTIQITSVEKVESVSTKCIRVNSKNNLFLCGWTMIPTHNTPLIAGIALCHLIGPVAGNNQQLYSAAFERDQASLTFRYMKQMVEMNDYLSAHLNIKVSAKEIECDGNGNTFKALSSEARSKHGISPALLIFDELAQFGADREFYDTLIQGRGAHLQPMTWIISTQASDDLAVLSQEIDYALKIGDDDPTVKLFLYTTPEDADLQDRDAWMLSNPALGDFLNEKDMIEAANTAVAMPSAEAGFRNLRLNQRTSSTARFMSLSVWQKSSGEQDEDALKYGRITAGLDLSGKNDLSALILDAYYEGIHNIYCYFWTPADSLKERIKSDRVPYQLWIDQGYLSGVPGKTIDYTYIAQKVADLHKKYDIAELRYDRWSIDYFKRALDAIGCSSFIKREEGSKKKSKDLPMPGDLIMLSHGQGYKDMNPAIVAVDDIFTESRARHNGHPVLTMCVSNAVVDIDPAGNRKFAKHKSVGRIDGIVAMAMAVNKAELPSVKKPQPIPTFF